MSSLDRTTVLAVIYATVCEFFAGFSPEQLTPNHRLMEDLDADFVEETDFLTKLGEHFPATDFANFAGKTLGDIADFICASAEATAEEEPANA